MVMGQPRAEPYAPAPSQPHLQARATPATFPMQQNRWQPQPATGFANTRFQPQQSAHPVMMAPSLAGGVRGGPAAQHLPQGYQPQPGFQGGAGGRAIGGVDHRAMRRPTSHSAGPPLAMQAQPGMMAAGPGGGGAVFF